MIGARLSHAFVFAVDVERVVAFYEGTFEMRRKPTPDSGFVFIRARAGGADNAVHGLPPHIALSIGIATPPQWRNETGRDPSVVAQGRS